ncbi:hypothetical protein LZ31DRAFT_275308 [Colletotrichum somersetense]|nr:hypothetical protein LZ31DRAFT_275308 [Colletotrichum somersetense]
MRQTCFPRPALVPVCLLLCHHPQVASRGVSSRDVCVCVSSRYPRLGRHGPPRPTCLPAYWCMRGRDRSRCFNAEFSLVGSLRRPFTGLLLAWVDASHRDGRWDMINERNTLCSRC